jgi:hypothetical protein
MIDIVTKCARTVAREEHPADVFNTFNSSCLSGRARS